MTRQDAFLQDAQAFYPEQVGWRRWALRGFLLLQGVSWIGLVLAIALTLASAVLGLVAANHECGSSAEREDCRNVKEMAQVATTIALVLFMTAIALFACLIVAAGGPRRRGQRWSQRHQGALLQARGWLADGQISARDFDPVANEFRAQERGEGKGQLMRAAGGCLVATGLLSLLASAGLAFFQLFPKLDENLASPAVAGALVMLAAFGIFLEVAGAPLHLAGRRITRLANLAFQAAMDDLARKAAEASATKRRTKTKA